MKFNPKKQLGNTATMLWLVRHGQTDWNIEGRYQGQADLPLNATGMAQAHNLAGQLKGEHFDAIFSSDLRRAQQTAAALGEVLDMPLLLDKRLREIHQGEWEGQLMSDIIRRYHKLYHDRSHDPEKARAPGGESVLEVSLRMIEAVNDITGSYPAGKVIIVSHGLALATIIAKSTGCPLTDVYQFIPDNASPQVIEWQMNGKSHKPI